MGNTIREAIKASDGKLIYVMELQQGDKNKIQLYINYSESAFCENREPRRPYGAGTDEPQRSPPLRTSSTTTLNLNSTAVACCGGSQEGQAYG